MRQKNGTDMGWKKPIGDPRFPAGVISTAEQDWVIL